MQCRCNDVTELYGQEAEAYAAEHLRADGVRSERFEERYTCPDTGKRWLLDWPDRTEQEPGQARLRVASGT